MAGFIDDVGTTCGDILGGIGETFTNSRRKDLEDAAARLRNVRDNILAVSLTYQTAQNANAEIIGYVQAQAKIINDVVQVTAQGWDATVFNVGKTLSKVLLYLSGSYSAVRLLGGAGIKLTELVTTLVQTKNLATSWAAAGAAGTTWMKSFKVWGKFAAKIGIVLLAFEFALNAVNVAQMRREMVKVNDEMKKLKDMQPKLKAASDALKLEFKGIGDRFGSDVDGKKTIKDETGKSVVVQALLDNFDKVLPMLDKQGSGDRKEFLDLNDILMSQISLIHRATIGDVLKENGGIEVSKQNIKLALKMIRQGKSFEDIQDLLENMPTETLEKLKAYVAENPGDTKSIPQVRIEGEGKWSFTKRAA